MKSKERLKKLKKGKGNKAKQIKKMGECEEKYGKIVDKERKERQG